MSGLQAIRVVGGIVPPSLLGRVQAGEVPPASLTPASYHLAGNETLRDATARAWSYLRGAWTAWRDADNPTTGTTRERWLIPLLRELGYGNVPALPQGLSIGEDRYPISHDRDHIPIHLLGPSVSLDRRNPGVAGAARAPQAMLQEFLNRSDDHLWALLSNGGRLRMLRDSTALAGSAYLEFDLDAIFEGELYNEFGLLFRIAHLSRLEIRGSDSGPADCWLEEWRTEAIDTGTRALDKLRGGVEKALTELGDGFLHHPDNRWLVTALRTGELSDHDYLRALLRLIYRLLFCFVAEDRNALLDPQAPAEGKQRYLDYFSTGRLRRLSRIRAGGPHPDLWQAQRLILKALGGHGLPQVAVPALGGLFDPDPRAEPVVDQPGPDLLLDASLSNHALLAAIRALAWVDVNGGRLQPVDYRNLGAEELGSVYESLLELIPRVDLADMTFRLDTAAGNDRKTTGSYYTPPALVSALLDTALDPLLDDAVKNADNATDAEQRLLALTVCDPASGSGGFLVAAARRIARRLAQVRSDEDEPTPEVVQHALRDVVGRCIYGVDLNDLAAELAKVSLWLEAMEPGKPLGFLDARIRVGNSLIGATPALLARGIPDNAFKEIEGDDKKYAAAIRQQNKAERAGQSSLFAVDNTVPTDLLADAREGIIAPSDDIDTIRHQAETWRAYEQSDVVRRAELQANAWCAAFVWPLNPDAPPPVTEDVFQQISTQPDATDLTDTITEVNRLTRAYRFFHWHLEFPEVFDDGSSRQEGPDGWMGGFSCLLGNPPWERVKIQEAEFFAGRHPDIAEAPNAATRRRLIALLEDADPPLFDAFASAKRRLDDESAFLRTTGRFPLNGRGRDINTASVFAELFRTLTAPQGRSGVIVPTGIATDATTQYFFKDLITKRSLAALYDFENRAGIFPDVDSRMKFCLLTVAGRDQREDAIAFAFFLRDPVEIDTHRFALTPDEITLVNPNTGTCPIFRTRRDAELVLSIYGRLPVLLHDQLQGGDPWGFRTRPGLFHMGNDSEMLEPATGTTEDPNVLPLYEAKYVHHYDHRWDPEGSDNCSHGPSARAPFRYVVPTREVHRRLSDPEATWLTGFRDVTNSTNERTLIPAVIPVAGVGDNFKLFETTKAPSWWLSSVMASFVADYCARLKMGGTHMSAFILKQVPLPSPLHFRNPAPWASESISNWITPRVAELTFTSHDMSGFAKALGLSGAPFVWDRERRFLLRCELDAAFFHIYGIGRVDVDYVMGTFPIVARKDEAEYGEYRTKRVIVEMYDALQQAIDSGVAYESPISPPPGEGPRHPERTESR